MCLILITIQLQQQSRAEPSANLDQTYFSKWIDYPCLQNGAHGSIWGFILIRAGCFVFFPTLLNSTPLLLNVISSLQLHRWLTNERSVSGDASVQFMKRRGLNLGKRCGIKCFGFRATPATSATETQNIFFLGEYLIRWSLRCLILITMEIKGPSD